MQHALLSYHRRMKTCEDETGQFPWDIEMVVEDPLSDDQDGFPDCDSHSN